MQERKGLPKYDLKTTSSSLGSVESRTGSFNAAEPEKGLPKI
jgi:hypothetical protein